MSVAPVEAETTDGALAQYTGEGRNKDSPAAKITGYAVPMIFWSFFLAFLFSVTAGLSLFLLGSYRHSLAAWVLVAALTLMAAQQGLRVLHATAATPALATAYTGMGLGLWPRIMVLASGGILDTMWWVRGVFVGIGLLGIGLAVRHG